MHQQHRASTKLPEAVVDAVERIEVTEFERHYSGGEPLILYTESHEKSQRETWLGHDPGFN
jgi:hypothetical protein